ncbi:glia maturation factor beta isoform X2 [Pogoniulus pusillus]|uniref:glia maturation factor beta isoform X2 n=1 Tax=Pogoniulus pusillus TaxID=488313 RepID=UPI000510D77F|nr:PREDICTED: glia maturation factor beta isoform X1 [Pelecanus crispus]
MRSMRFVKCIVNKSIFSLQCIVVSKGISPDELKDELPERQPRFIVYSYKYQHDDGRVSYPLCFIFSSPVGCKPEQQMMYAGSKNKLVQTAELTKVFEIRNTEDLTEEWLREKLGFFH